MTRNVSTHLPQSVAARIARTTARTAIVGSLAFFVGVVLHPGRTGWDIAAAPQYGVVHELIAFGLAVQLAALVGFRTLFAERLGRAGDWSFWIACVGAILQFALILFDGSHNPAVAQFRPEIVHTPSDIADPAVLFVLPALVLFPAGQVVWGFALRRASLVPAWPLVCAALGASVYSLAGVGIFVFGPDAAVVPAGEMAGAALFALGFASSGLLVGRQAAPAFESASAYRTGETARA